MVTGALVLSGGESTRWGGYPKALLDAGGRPAVQRIAEVCLSQGLHPVTVVVGPHRGPVAHALKELPVEIVSAERWWQGRTASIQAGLAAIPEDRDVLFWPVDHPFVRASTVETLRHVAGTDLLGIWFLPAYHERGGHPVLWRAPVRRDILELRPDAPLRSLLPEFGPQVRRVDVEDPGVVGNVDTIEQYNAARDAYLAAGGD
ncbi:MAG TPA: nucleotidyltransferase family protein [Thermoplasmata archaeon]|nr:nucleotidyltransferase family protein [Thermoplasmata archaeon]